MNLKKQLQVCDWKGFEQIISEVLELHNYTSFWNVNLTIEGKRRQYDVVAIKNNQCIVIDCKKWDNRRSKISALKTAVKKHIQRCQFYNLLMQKTITPVIVIYNEEPIMNYKNCYVVSVDKLNDFLLKI